MIRGNAKTKAAAKTNRRAAWLTGIALLAVSGLFVQQWMLMKQEGLLARFAPISVAPIPASLPNAAAKDLKSIKRLLSDVGFARGDKPDFRRLVELQRWLGNQVGRIEQQGPSKTTTQLLAHIKLGRGLSCEGMATVFRDLAMSLGVPVRLVQLYRSNFDRLDTHVLVEALIDERNWVALDPTFNLSFQDEHGRPVGVEAIRSSLAMREAKAVYPVYHGDRRYPANTDEYYLDWRVLYGNAYVIDSCEECSQLERLPPFRYWHGPVRYAFGEGLGTLARQHNRLYFTVVVILPSIITALLLSTWWLISRERSH